MMKLKVIFLIYFLTSQLIFAQQEVIDSLEAKLEKVQNGKEKVEILNQLARLYYQNSPAKAKRYAEQGLQMTEKDAIERAKVLITLGIIYNSQKNFEPSLQYLEEALEIVKKLKNKEAEADVLHNIGVYYYGQNQYEKALAYYLQSLKIIETLGDEPGLTASYANIALVYRRLGRLNEAEDYLKKAEKIAIKYNNLNELLRIQVNLAGVYVNQQHFDKALTITQKAIKNAQKIPSKMGEARARSSLMRIYLAQKKYDSAIREVQITRQLFQDIGDERSYILTFSDEAEVHMAQQNYATAEKAFQKTLELNQDVQDKMIFMHAYAYLYKLYKIQERFEDALQAQDNYILYKDSVLKENTIKQIEELQANYQTEKKEQEIFSLEQSNTIKDLENQQQRSNIIILSVILLVLILLILAVFLFYSRRQVRVQQKNEEIAQKLLRLQMNPHFIFNALNNIQSFVLKKDKQQASDYLSLFSRLMRQILESSRENYITLEEEVEILENYLTLQQLRFYDKFDYIIEVDENIEIESISVPPMFAQPFIENAIEHGIANLEKQGKIKIHFSQQDSFITLNIQDNGIGIEAAAKIKEKTEKEYQSLATKITKERIQLFQKSIHKKINFKIHTKDSGTQISLQLPYQTI